MMGVGAKRALGLYRSCAPRHLRAQELLNVDGLMLLPDALRSTKVRDAAPSGNPGARENQNSVGVSQEIDEPSRDR